MLKICIRLKFIRVIMIVNLMLILSICGIVCINLKFVFDVMSIKLLGSGVIEVIKVKLIRLVRIL